MSTPGTLWMVETRWPNREWDVSEDLIFYTKLGAMYTCKQHQAQDPKHRYRVAKYIRLSYYTPRRCKGAKSSSCRAVPAPTFQSPRRR